MAEGSIDIKKVKGDVFGAGVEGSGNIFGKNVTTIENQTNQTINLNLSLEASELFGKIAAMKTELRPGEAAGIQGSKTPEDNAEVQKGINEILELLKTPGKSGQFAREIQAGDLRISRVDLLVKKATLLKTEADQMLFDHLERNKNKIEQARARTGQVDLNSVFKDFDETARMSRLKEAYALLQEANELDPTNTEVLLHIAKLLIELTPDDTSDETRILYRIRNLLGSPKDDTERFHLAQATFLLATTSEPMHIESLSDARAMFEKLGRTEWVRQCDDLIAARGRDASYRAMEPASALPQMAGFQPVGNWHIRVMDAVGSTMLLNINPDSTFQAVQQLSGLNIHAVGQWVFNPYNQMLQLQGMVNDFQPFMLGIIIQGQQYNGYNGTGTDGYGYFMTRA
jgi:hypothetical protein